jgi:hypothetical protein
MLYQLNHEWYLDKKTGTYECDTQPLGQNYAGDQNQLVNNLQYQIFHFFLCNKYRQP